MEHTVFSIASKAKGLDLECVTTRPESGEPKGILQIVHGMAEHKERYLPFMEFLSSNGYICITPDLRGHGKSVINPEDIGFFYGGRSSEMVEDMLEVNRYARSLDPSLPVFMLGHSMGALIARWYLHEYPQTIQGTFVTGNPGYSPATKGGLMLCKMLSFLKGSRKRSPLMDSLVVGAFSKSCPGESRNAWISYDPRIVNEYDKDPLCGFPLTLDGYRCLLEMLLKVNDRKLWNLPQRDIPVVLLSGSDDVCMAGEKSFEDAADILRKGGFPNTKTHIYQGMRHEILNEKEKGKVFSDILAYMDDWSRK
ncbi:MAG: lysophospholipase [Bacteroidales bacterium]|nr:lysophospholipase [Bacteroidales bacterium]